jgi:hypothetical protein
MKRAGGFGYSFAETGNSQTVSVPDITNQKPVLPSVGWGKSED